MLFRKSLINFPTSHSLRVNYSKQILVVGREQNLLKLSSITGFIAISHTVIEVDLVY